MFIEEDCQIWNMAQTLESGIQITRITEIHQANLTLFVFHRDTWLRKFEPFIFFTY